MIVNKNTITALRTEYRKLFDAGFAKIDPVWKKICTEMPSSGRTGEYHFPIFEGLREWLGDRVVANLVKHGFSITNKHFEKTYGIPIDDIEDDNLGGYTSMFTGLGQLAAQHPDGLVATMLLDAFAGSSYTSYDGLSMCNDAHVLNGRTIDNSGTAALSDSNFAAGMAILMSMYGADAQKTMIFAPLNFKLVVPPQLFKTAKEITDNAHDAYGKENVLKGTAQTVILPQLASQPAYWFIMAEFAGVWPIIMQMRKKPQFTAMDTPNDEGVFMDNQIRYGVDYRGNIGWGPWELLYGSTGAGA